MGMGRVKVVRELAVAAVLLGGMVACSEQDVPDDAGQKESSERIDYTNVDVPEDRDSDAVQAALGSIDPCALIDPSGVGVEYFSTGSKVRALSPHTCEVSKGEVRVRVKIGVAFSFEDRYNAGLESLGDARAYVVPGGDSLGLCQVALPVDHTQAIMVSGSYASADNRDACDNAKDFARAAAKRLKEPDAVAQRQSPAKQTACDILRPAVELDDGSELRSGQDPEYGVDECGVWEKVEEGELQPAAPDIGLTVQYRDSIPDYYTKAGRVRGRQLHASHCDMSWNERKAVGTGASGKAVFKVTAPSCKKAKSLVGDVADVIDNGGVSEPSEPQRPVLYAADEPDAPAAGACIDVMDADENECQPYAETEAPADGEETIEAATDDPNVNCAIATEAVEEHFGSHLRPVTAVHGIGQLDTPARLCGFVEESHALQVWIGVSKDSMPESATSEIDGRPAHDETTTSEGERTMSVALDDEGESGYLYAEVIVNPDREDGNFDESPVDKAPLDNLDEVVTDVVSAHFRP